MRGSTFPCLVRAELRKAVLQPSNWAVPVIAVAIGLAADAAARDQAAGLAPFPAVIDTYRMFAAAVVGVIVLAVSARLVAEEYQQGTVRVLLAGGVGRLRLLAAKLAAVAVVALPVLAVLAVAGAVDVALELRGQPASAAWGDVWPSEAVVVLSAGVGAVIGSAAGAAGRSMTFAMAVAAGFFPVDNALGYVLPLLQNATQEHVWGDLSTYLLGPTLNHLPSVLMGRRAAELVPPEWPVDAAHSLLVVGGYVAVLAAAAVVVTWRRDTLE
jgi:ABC-2 type transport system permease protein